MDSMNQHIEPALQAHQQTWKTALTMIGVFLAVMAVGFYSTLESMVSIWLRSETFTHGFIIFPITLWLLWQERDHILQITPKATALCLVPLTGAGLLWLLGTLVDALVIQQLAWVSMVIIGVWGLLGNQLALRMAFPLGFLLFMVPVGEGLIAPMMEFTATSTVWLIRLSDIPVYREGLFFMLPTGNWSVVEACSGVRYLIASVTLGFLYAYLTYRSLWKRSVFVLVSVAVPVLANSLRAYIIVMIGHHSDMKLATGADHLVYGWVFFGFVMFILFWLGSLFREDEAQPDDESSEPNAAEESLQASEPVNRARWVSMSAVIVGTVCVWPLLAGGIYQDEKIGQSMSLLPPIVDGWEQQRGGHWQWKSHYAGADAEFKAGYFVQNSSGGDIRTDLVVQYYRTQSQGRELVNAQVLKLDSSAGWRRLERTTRTVALKGGAIRVEQTLFDTKQGKLLSWAWYRVGEQYTSNAYVAKLWEAAAKLLRWGRGGARIAVVTAADQEADLESFVTQMLPALERDLERLSGDGHG